MGETFETKVRKVGTSLGVLIPSELAEREGIKEGEKDRIGLLKEKKLEEVLKLFGTAKGSGAFARDQIDRLDRY